VLGRGWPDDRAGLGKRAAGNLDGSDRRDKDKATTQKEDRRKRNKSEPSSRLGAIQDGTTGSLQDQLVLKAAEAAEERRQKKKEEKKRSKKDPSRELLKILTTQLSSHKKHTMKDKKEEKEKEKREKRRPGDSTWGELPLGLQRRRVQASVDLPLKRKWRERPGSVLQMLVDHARNQRGKKGKSKGKMKGSWGKSQQNY